MTGGLAAVFVDLGHGAQLSANTRRQRGGERRLPRSRRTIEQDIDSALAARERSLQHRGHDLGLAAEMLEGLPREKVRSDRTKELIVEIRFGKRILANQRHQTLQHVQFTIRVKVKQ